MTQPHIHLSADLGVRHAILPGDPGRIDRILPFLSQVRELGFHREYRSALGLYQGLPVLAMSTGMGGASMGIAVEELRNIGVTAAVRIGSCGALQPGIGLGDQILVTGAVRDDGASQSYAPAQYPGVPDLDLLWHCRQASDAQEIPYHLGLCRSHDSFYIDNSEEISTFWSGKGILGADMETAALFTVGRLRGLRCASILNNVVIWGESTGGSIGAYSAGEDMTAVGEQREISIALEALYRLSQTDEER